MIKAIFILPVLISKLNISSVMCWIKQRDEVNLHPSENHSLSYLLVMGLTTLTPRCMCRADRAILRVGACITLRRTTWPTQLLCCFRLFALEAPNCIYKENNVSTRLWLVLHDIVCVLDCFSLRSFLGCFLACHGSAIKEEEVFCRVGSLWYDHGE